MTEPKVPIEVVLAAVLMRTASQFRFYEGQHLAKGPSGEEKAKVNAEWATLCDDYAHVALGVQGAAPQALARYVVKVRPIATLDNPRPSWLIDDTRVGDEGLNRIVCFGDPTLADRVCALLNAWDAYRGQT